MISLGFQGINAGLAQLVEHLICNQGVVGSSPITGTISEDFSVLSVAVSDFGTILQEAKSL
jgi:hypothetical protein